MSESTGDGGEGVRPGRPTLSVVVITHNERERIETCLESIFAAIEGLESVEVVLVDSRSDDGTVELAREFPIEILRLPAEPAVTPSAGRYVGTTATDGDLVLFVDGDMVLADDWLADACQRVQSDPDLAGVDGHLRAPGAETDEPVDVLRGVALYDRRALETVGGFDPFLAAMEDIDLSFRLDDAGYDLVRLGDVVASHPPRNPDGERRRRWRRGYYEGRGQLFRKYSTRPRLFARLAYRTRLYLVPPAWASTAPLARRVGGTRGLVVWLLATVGGLAVIAGRQGTDWTADKLVATVPVLAGIALGLGRERRSPAEYPLDAVETVQSTPADGPVERVTPP